MTRDQLLSNLRAMRKDAWKLAAKAHADQVGWLIANADMDFQEAAEFAVETPNPTHAAARLAVETLDAAITALGKVAR